MDTEMIICLALGLCGLAPKPRRSSSANLCGAQAACYEPTRAQAAAHDGQLWEPEAAAAGGRLRGAARESRLRAGAAAASKKPNL